LFDEPLAEVCGEIEILFGVHEINILQYMNRLLLFLFGGITTSC